MTSEPSSERTRLRRLPERGKHDRATIDAIIDEALICHVAFSTDDGPVVIPTIHAREGDTLYLHGSAASRMLRIIREGEPICVNMTIIDGLVMARSLFNHSMNYRSVILFGTAREITDPDEKLASMRLVSEHMSPGRWNDARRPNDKELRATMMVAIPLDEASAKVRTGPPGDNDEDYDLDVWAGVIPVELTFGEPQPDPRLRDGIEVPKYLQGFGRSAGS